MVQPGSENPEQVKLLQDCKQLVALANQGEGMSVGQAEQVMGLITALFRSLMDGLPHDSQHTKAIITKFRDAGRRSPPWRATSPTVVGLPQDGADGNRRNRWDFKADHKFYADKKTANFVEIKYYLQALSMDNAPAVPCEDFADAWRWLVNHRVEPGKYRDPIQLISVDLNQFVANRRYVESGHLVPLDRGGRHVPGNSFLMITESNRMQGNLTVDELLHLMKGTLERQKVLGYQFKD